MSAARLAAELAFSLPPRPSTPDSGPIVVVRRTRGLYRAQPDAAAQGATAEDADAGHKGPRIFRVAPEPAADAGPNGPALQVQEGPSAPRAPRRRALTADRRPGPLLQVYQAPVQPQADSGATASSGLSPKRLQALASQLAGIDPVFDDILRAQAFRFREDASDAAWQGLSVAADEVHGWIRAQLDSASVLPEAAEEAPRAPAPAGAAAQGPSRDHVFQRRRP